MSDTDSLIGKTIARFAECEDKLLIFFTDGDYAVFRSVGSDGDCSPPELSYLDSPRWSGAVQNRVAAGLITVEDGEVLIARMDAEAAAAREIRERLDYKRLQKKYGGE